VHESGARPLRQIGHGRLALVVDDSEDNREIYASYLAHHGFRVDEARDGSHALEKIEQELPDVIVMDLAMPVLDGWEATRRLKSDERTKGVVIVVVTGHAFGEALRRASDSGADAVLTKPCRPQEVLEAITDLLEP